MKRTTQVVCALAALLAVTTLPATALADGKDFNDGPVINVAAIRTVDGHFDEYMHWLDTVYKHEQEAAKKAGLIMSYRVILVEARGANDPDVYLVTEYKNWAALDGLNGKFEKTLIQVEGSVENANKSESDRSKIRTVLGSRTEQEALLK
ncbi:MAG: hypothetical protein ACLPTM_11255 [Steroidobacteraceae bacterium]